MKLERCVLAVLVLLAPLLATPTAPAAEKAAADPQAERQAVVRLMARDLLAGLHQKVETGAPAPEVEKTLKERMVDAAGRLEKWWREEPAAPSAVARKRKIAIWPFWKDETVVAEDFAEMLSDSLLAELVRNKADTDEYVAREDLKIVTRDIDEFNSLRQSSEKIGQLIREAGADILIIGEVKPETDGRAVFVRYRATSVLDGSIPATTDWHRLGYDFDRTPAIGAADAVKRSARYFREHLAAIRTLRPQGIRYADSGVQTPFGAWFAARLVSELQRVAGGPGATINVADAEVPPAKHESRGLQLARREAAREMVEAPTGDYVLSGRYWLLGDRIDLQLAMTDGGGRTVAWQGDVRASSVDLALTPSKTVARERETDNLGPIALHIGSARGVNPVYHLGQRLVVFVEASRASHLYCFYRQADGAVMRVFPNRHHRDARIAGGELQRIPGPDMQFDWIVGRPTGTELMKCYAFDRDVWAELPEAVRAADFEPLPYRSVEALTGVMRTIRRAAIAENSMVVNVEE